MSELATLVCVCGHAADDHAIDDPSWVVPVCLTQYYRDASDCRCEYYEPAQ